MRLRIGTRPSRLALAQVKEAIALVRGHVSLPAGGGTSDTCPRFEIVTITTVGDKDKVTPLEKLEGSDFFTREINRALLDNEIDMAVHSAKDIEDDSPEGLIVALMTEPISKYECLAAKDNLKLNYLKYGAIIGTSSKNRKENILKLRPDLIVRDIRGDIGERIAQLDQGKYDAIIVAHAALLRLKLENRIAQIFSLEEMPPHPLQGRIAVQIKEDRKDLLGLFGVGAIPCNRPLLSGRKHGFAPTL